MPTLKQWSITSHPATPYTAPELIRPRLSGIVYDHPNFADGTIVTTSTIRFVDGRTVITNSGSVYHLGKVSEEYQAMYPDYDLNGPCPIKY